MIKLIEIHYFYKDNDKVNALRIEKLLKKEGIEWIEVYDITNKFKMVEKDE